MINREDITYRKAILADARKLSILYKQVYMQTYGVEGVSDEFANFITLQFAVERIQHTIRTQPHSLIVAVYNNNLVGVAELVYDKTTPVGNITGPELGKLYILEWFCGIGIGHRLLAMAEQQVLSLGYDKLWLWVLASNERAVSFYERQQYRHIGNAPFQMEVNSYDNKVMLKHLRQATNILED